jgi:penicillin-binding protein 1C
MHKWHFYVLTAILAFIVSVFLLDRLFPPDLARFTTVSKELRTQQNQLVHVLQTPDEKWRLKVAVKDVDPLYLNMLIEREDRFFWHHSGVNPCALLRAGYQRLRQGKIISGGSTLTMQVARLLEPRPRSLKAKSIEILRAIQLEARFTKQQILEIYLTLAPYGGNLEGIRAAAFSYFGKSPQRLTPAEAALLIVLPQSPKRWQKTQFHPSTQVARNRVLSLAYQRGLVDKTTYNVALQEPLPRSRVTLPREMRHLARRLCSSPAAPPISYCTIQPAIQRQVESIAFEAVKNLPPEANIAILVVHHTSHQVVAYVGSSDFLDSSRQGQVDYVTAYRSPGSTLKPFIYGVAFDQGILHPSSYVLDDRHRFGTYLPDNFDKTFHGMVTAGEALTLSLNIPVVSMLSQIGPQRFLGMLEEAGIQPRFPDIHSPAGLSIALGGIGMTLEQLVTLYTALPQGGELSPLILSCPMEASPPHHIFSGATAAQLTNILLQTFTNEFGQATQAFALKTGTSHGHRDAWAIGYNNQYVVGVWIGRPDGVSIGVGTGRSLAVPVLEQIFTLLPQSKHHPRRVSHKPEVVIQRPATARHQQQTLYRQRPQLLFPVNDTVIERFRTQGESHPIMLSAMGGKRPYTWLIDGMPLATNVWTPKTPWNPDKPGFYAVTLLDSQGLSAIANVEIQ